MEINNMTRKQFNAIPYRKKWNEDVVCDSIVILPGYSREIHDSGYRSMDFVAVKGGEPICRLSGCSDVIHVDGIGGYGFDWVKRYGGVPKLVFPSSWSIDCLPKSGLLRMFCNGKIVCSASLSSFEIYRKENTDDQKG